MKKLFTLILILTTVSYAKFSFSATFIWAGSFNGDGITWEDEDNWVDGNFQPANAIPGPSDEVVFDFTSDNVIINSNVTVERILLNNAFAGTLTVNAGNSLTVNDLFRIDGSNQFNGGSSPISINNLQIINGTFNSTSGTLTITSSMSLGVDGVFNHQNGIVNLGAGTSVTELSLTGNFTFNNLTVTNAGAGIRNCTINDAISILGNILYSVSGTNTFRLNGNTISLNGNIIMPGFPPSSSTNNGGTSTISLVGTGNQSVNSGNTNITLNQRRLPSININKSSGTTTFNNNIYVSGNLSITDDGDGVTFGPSISIGETFSFDASHDITTFTNSTLVRLMENPKNFDAHGKTIKNLVIGSNVTLTGDLTIEEEITFSGNNRTLTTTGQTLTLLSDGGKTARIGTLTSGSSIVGNISQQRFLPSGTTGWMFLGSPVSNATYQQWADVFPTSGFPGSDAPGSSFNSIMLFDETVQNSYTVGYQGIADAADNIPAGRGHWTYVGSGQTSSTSFLLEMLGTPNTGDFSFPVTFSPGANAVAAEQGWNLIANPYPSAIDWELVHGDAATNNVDGQIHIYNQDLNGGAGGYATYTVGGASTNGGSNIIPTGQGFYVKTSGGPSLIAKEAHKSSVLTQSIMNTYSPNGQNFLRLELTRTTGNRRDETLIRFMDGATEGFDELYDANKLSSSNIQASEISSIVNGEKLAINALPDLDSSFTIPLHIKAVNGTYTISAFNLNEFNKSSCLTLEDSKTGDIIDLRNQNSYTFTFSTSDAQPRFFVTVGEQTKFEAELDEITCYNAEDAVLNFTPISNGNYNLFWTDANNDTIRQTLNTANADALNNVGEGFYQLAVQRIGACGTADIIDFNVQNPLPNISDKIEVDASCSNSYDGQAILILENNGPWDVIWTDVLGNTVKQSNNISGNDTLNIGGGIYYANISFNNSCDNVIDTFQIDAPVVINADFNTINEICYGTTEGFLEISNLNNTPVNIYLTQNGDTVNNVNYISGNYTFNNLNSGQYSVEVLFNNNCGTLDYNFTITEGDENIADFIPSAYNTFIDDTVDFTNTSFGADSYTWDFGDGSPTSNLENPSHVYLVDGNYDVTLSATNTDCNVTTNKTESIVVSKPTSSRFNQKEEDVKFIDNNQGFFVQLNLSANENVVISAFDMTGKQVIENIVTSNGKGLFKLDLPENTNNVFMIRVISKDNSYSYKTFK